jgi:hypothetical protein
MEDPSSENPRQKLMQLDKEINDQLTYNTVQIVRNYVENNSIKCIQIEESSDKMLIMSPLNEADAIAEFEQQQPTMTPQDHEKVIADIENESVEMEYIEEVEALEEESDRTTQIEYESVDDIETNSNTSMTKAFNLKRPRHTEEWKCNKRKKLRNSGQTYVNTKGNIVEGRKMLPSCECRVHCEEKISEDEREANFNKFWSLGDVIEQRKFIYKHLISKEPTRRKSSGTGSRSVTLQFYLDKTDEAGNFSLVHVCKKMFKNTLCVSNQVIQGVVKKYSNTNFVDTRGKHERKLTEAQELAKEHAQQFPFFYVEQNMTKVQLYNMYTEQCKEQNIIPVKESNYREIFDKYNSNSFLKTEKILCEKCDDYFKATEEKRVDMQKEHDQHLADDKKCRDRALGRIRHRRSIARKREERLKTVAVTE